MQVFAGMSPSLPLAAVGSYAARVERLGFDGLIVPETVRDAFTTATLAVEHTSRLHVRIGVLVAFVRSPMQVAYAAWSVQELAAGRFSLGLGTQVRGNIEQRYSVPWSDPVGRMADYVESLRAIWAAFASSGGLDVSLAHYRFGRLQPYFNPGPIDAPAPEIWLGGVSPRMVSLAGQVADGFLAHPTGSHPSVLPDLGGVPVVVAPPLAAGRTAAEVDAARRHQRETLAFLHSTPAYRGVLDRLGRGDVADRLHALSREQRWADLPAVVDDDLLAELAPAGTWPQVAEVLVARYAGVVAGVTVTPPADESADADLSALVSTLRAAPGAP